MQLKIKKIKSEAVLPTRAHHDDAGIDMYACGEYVVEPGVSIKIGTGVALHIEEGNVGLIWDKSGVSSKGIKTLGGVIDAGYRGEVFVTVHNLGNTSYLFEHGQKVAQLLIQKVEFPELIEVEELEGSVRGERGFGSTGK